MLPHSPQRARGRAAALPLRLQPVPDAGGVHVVAAAAHRRRAQAGRICVGPQGHAGPHQHSLDEAARQATQPLQRAAPPPGSPGRAEAQLLAALQAVKATAEGKEREGAGRWLSTIQPPPARSTWHAPRAATQPSSPTPAPRHAHWAVALDGPPSRRRRRGLRLRLCSTGRAACGCAAVLSPHRLICQHVAAAHRALLAAIACKDLWAGGRVGGWVGGCGRAAVHVGQRDARLLKLSCECLRGCGPSTTPTHPPNHPRSYPPSQPRPHSRPPRPPPRSAAPSARPAARRPAGAARAAWRTAGACTARRASGSRGCQGDGGAGIGVGLDVREGGEGRGRGMPPGTAASRGRAGTAPARRSLAAPPPTACRPPGAGRVAPDGRGVDVAGGAQDRKALLRAARRARRAHRLRGRQGMSKPHGMHSHWN